MNNIKPNTTGIDIAINKSQIKIYNKLNFGIDFHGYGRCYLFTKPGNVVVPTVFTDGLDYKEILVNDTQKGHFFFVEKPEAKAINSAFLEAEVDIIFMLNLVKLYAEGGRKDAQAYVDVIEAVRSDINFSIDKITKGNEALNDFNTDLQDLQPYHFIKVSGTIKYKINC